MDDASTPLARVMELGLLSASLLHELRQPLFAIQAHTQLALADGRMTSERLLELSRQVTHLTEVLDAYGDVGRAPLGLFDLNDAVRAALLTVGPRSDALGVRVAATLAGEALPVRGRPVALRQVTINLVANALEAVSGRAGHVWVETRAVGERVELRVRDDGPGFEQDLKDRAFDPFVSTKSGEVSGLGLYVTKRLVEEVGGEVRVRSGAGATVVVSLPRAG